MARRHCNCKNSDSYGFVFSILDISTEPSVCEFESHLAIFIFRICLFVWKKELLDIQKFDQNYLDLKLIN